MHRGQIRVRYSTNCTRNKQMARSSLSLLCRAAASRALVTRLFCVARKLPDGDGQLKNRVHDASRRR